MLLLTLANRESPFLLELIKQRQTTLTTALGEPIDITPCPVCRQGRMTRRTNRATKEDFPGGATGFRNAGTPKDCRPVDQRRGVERGAPVNRTIGQAGRPMLEPGSPAVILRKPRPQTCSIRAVIQVAVRRCQKGCSAGWAEGVIGRWGVMRLRRGAEASAQLPTDAWSRTLDV